MISRLFLSLILSFLSLNLIASETIVSDNIGNAVTLPLAGGDATATITNSNTRVSTSPYVLSVYVNNGNNSQSPVNPGTRESYWFHPPNNGALYGNATLVASAFSPDFITTGMVAANPVGQFLGSQANPVNTTGIYTFTFTIPVLQTVNVVLTYINSGAPQPVIDVITIRVDNPAAVVGDPQFVGLRGQSFQVHGIDGAIYNIVSGAHMQVNARFVFLSEGKCPILNGIPEPNCWSHEGSYLGEMSFQQIVDGKLHQALVSAGSADEGFAGIVVDGHELAVGEVASYGTFSVTFKSTHVVEIETELFTFVLSNSDMFINQAVSNKVALSKLNTHGLLGQTHASKIYNTPARYIEGEVDDYVIQENDMFGTDFAYNLFTPL